MMCLYQTNMSVRTWSLYFLLVGYFSFCPVRCVTMPSEDISQDRTTLPDGWNQACLLNQSVVDWQPKASPFNWSQPMLKISCMLPENHTLDWEDFTGWTNQTNESFVALEITCSSVNKVGAVNIPWPMKVRGLVYLKVHNCGLKEYLEKLSSDDFLVIPDVLRVLEITSSAIYLRLKDIRSYITRLKHITKDTHCGSLLLEKLVLRNMSLGLARAFNATDWAEVTSLYRNNLTGMYRELQLLPWTCDYNNLQYIDESNGMSLSQNVFFTKWFKARLPELRIFNLSNVGTGNVPIEFSNWRFKHPKLEYLDLSHNRIKTFRFTEYGSKASSNSGVIDLRFNNITEISSNELFSLQRLKSAFIDLSDNPISCECGKNSFLYKFLEDNPTWPSRLARYEYLRIYPCSSPSELKGTPFNESISWRKMYCKTGHYVTMIVTVTLLSVTVIVLIILVVVIRRLKSRQPKSSLVIFAAQVPADDMRN